MIWNDDGGIPHINHTSYMWYFVTRQIGDIGSKTFAAKWVSARTNHVTGPTNRQHEPHFCIFLFQISSNRYSRGCSICCMCLIYNTREIEENILCCPKGHLLLWEKVIFSWRWGVKTQESGVSRNTVRRWRRAGGREPAALLCQYPALLLLLYTDAPSSSSSSSSIRTHSHTGNSSVLMWINFLF